MLEPLKKGFVLAEQYEIEEMIGCGAVVTAYKTLKIAPGGQMRCLLKEVTPAALNLKRGSEGDVLCPKDAQEAFEEKKKQFLNTLSIEEAIRLKRRIVNELPGHVTTFEAQGTVYAEVPFYKGEVLSDTQMDLSGYVRAVLAATRTVSAFHREGFLVLDIKPSNIFVLQDASECMRADMVLFIDTGSLVKTGDVEREVLEFTEGYAAPELLQGSKRYLVSERTDYYALAECLFVYLFHRHSRPGEHRGFSEYPFEMCGDLRLEARNLFSELFRGTLRSSPENRFSRVKDITDRLEKLVSVLEEKVYPVSRRPREGRLIGREEEKAFLTKALKETGCVFITGAGGMGKTSLLEGWMRENAGVYSEIIYLKYKRDLMGTFNRDFFITTVRKYEAETEEDFFVRKFETLSAFAKNRRVLIAIDDYAGPVTCELERLLSGPFDVVVSGRGAPGSDYGRVCRALPLKTRGEQICLFERHLGRRIRSSETEPLLRLLTYLNGHTLFTVLLAKQVAASHMKISEAADLVEKPGFTEQFQEKVALRTDRGEERKRLSDILKGVLDKSGLKKEHITLLKVFGALGVSVRFEMLRRLSVVETFDDINSLISNGILFTEEDAVYLPPVFFEAVHTSYKEVPVKDRLLKVMRALLEHSDEESLYLSENLLAGCAEFKEEKAYGHLLYHVFRYMAPYREGDIFATGETLLKLLKDNVRRMDVYGKLLETALQKSDFVLCEALLKEERDMAKIEPTEEIRALYFESLAAFFDAALSGAYDAETKEEKEMLRQLLKALLREEACLKHLKGRRAEAVRVSLSLAVILSRSHPEKEEEIFGHLKEASDTLRDIRAPEKALLRDYYMALGWTQVYVHPNLKNMEKYLYKAQKIERARSKEALSLTEFVIPAANMFLELGAYEKALSYLQEGIALCNARSMSPYYRRMREDLLAYQKDVYRYSD